MLLKQHCRHCTLQNMQTAAAPADDTPSAPEIDPETLKQARAVFGSLFREILLENNSVLKNDISGALTGDVVREIDFLLQAKERRQEEYFRKLDSLIRQQQTHRKEAARNAAVKLKKLSSSVLNCGYCCRSSFPKRVYCGIHARRTVPTGPFLCLAIIISAIFLSSVSGL